MRAILIDVEGTVLESGRLVAGAAEAIGQLREARLPIRFVTNIDSRPVETVAAEIRSAGLAVDASEIFTPVAAAVRLLDSAAPARVDALVNDALRPVFARFEAGTACTHVVVGDCREVVTGSLLDRAFRELRGGAQLLAFQKAGYVKDADGDHLDTGAFVAALEYAADVHATVVGKPSPDFFRLALASADCPASDAVVVGDDATSDIAGGRAVGARTVQVMTGKYADQAAARAVRADDEIDSIAGLPRLLLG